MFGIGGIPSHKMAVQFKLFDMYDAEGVEVKDPALRPYLCLTPKLMVKSMGRRNMEYMGNTKVNVVERLANRLQVPGHFGKKHKIITSWSSGKSTKNMTTVLQAFEMIAKKTGKNPVQVFVTAIENGSPRDEVTVIEQAGAKYPQAVDCSPIRRINLAIRWMIQGAYTKSFGKKKKMAETLADEIVKASEMNAESFAYNKRNEVEKQADSAR